MRERTAAVVGLGLIGGSLGGALRRAGYRVRGYDLVARNAERARQRGLADELASGVGDVVSGAHVVLVAVPVLRSLKLLVKLDGLTESDVTVIDAGSAKAVVVETMGFLPGAERMVGGHPLAGNEQSGPDAADADLFRDRPFFLSRNSQTSDAAATCAEAVVSDLGARAVWIDAVEHDRVLASTSHLPQILATLLAPHAPSPDLAGRAFRDMTRLAASDSSIWRDILLANGREIVRAGREYGSALEAVLVAIEREDVTAIEETFIRGRNARATLEAGA